MGAFNNSGDARSIAFESFGVRLRVTANTPEVIERLPVIVPPEAVACPPSTVDGSFGVLADGGGLYRFERDDDLVSTGLDLELALILLENQVRNYIGSHAPNTIFVQGGVVVHAGRAIVIPGPSFAGKSTLVRELVHAGAVYYSDEFAVLDQRGLVHRYLRAPALRGLSSFNGVDIDALDTGLDDEPVPVGTVVITTYRPGANWSPTRVSPGRGVLKMFAHAPAASRRPQETIRVITKAIEGATVLEGERGEAHELAPQLLHTVSTQSHTSR